MHHHDPHLHLFVDDFEIETRENLARIVNKPRKHTQPVIVSDRPWEGPHRVQAWGSILQEPDGKLRGWYFTLDASRNAREMDRGGCCYAESTDGIHWTKPDLGIVEFRGSKQNNLFYCFNSDGKNRTDELLATPGNGLQTVDAAGNPIGLVNHADGLTVVRDDEDPDPQRRYKMFANMQDHRMWARAYPGRYGEVSEEQFDAAWKIFGQFMDTSPDGIHWTRRPVRIADASADYMMVLRDHRNRRWWLNERAKHTRPGRNAAIRTSDDLIDWSEPQIHFDNQAESEDGRLWEWHGGMTPFNYGNLDLGFLERWTNVGFGDTCELICHRDGHPWQRIAPGTPFLENGPEGAFDRVLAYPTHNAPIRIGNRLHIYYTGAAAANAEGRSFDMAIGLATISIDRFAGLAHMRNVAGTLLTKPVECDGDRLEINAESLRDGKVKVALRTADNQPIEGHQFEDCQLELSVDEPRIAVKWRNGRTLAHLNKSKIRLQFEVKHSALYAFRFA